MTIVDLPTTGTFHVDTLHSVYTIDTDRRLFRREPMHDKANNLTNDNDTVAYDAILCRVDGHMYLGLPNGKIRVTTPVLGITVTDEWAL